MKTLPDTGRETSLRFLSELFAANPVHDVAVRLWDGTLWPDDQPRPVTLALQHEGALRAMFGSGTEKGLGEAYLQDDFDVLGNMEAAFEITDALAGGPGWKQSLALAVLLRKLPAPAESHGQADVRPAVDSPHGFFGRNRRPHSLARDRHAISFHYDLSNEFYRLWLDRQMVYSCAYFAPPELDLDAAQAAKLDYLCRKLRLRPGQRVLDIGCGWGGLILHATRHYGVNAVGVTLSDNQAQLANERIAEAGIGDRAKVLLRDYRELDEPGTFDAIVSVGMSEHVGRQNLSGYFKSAQALLKPGGVFLNHAIGEGSRYRPSHGPSFIEAHVFPDSDIPPLRIVIEAAERAGFEVRDVENLREHYALTLRHWVRRLEAAHEAALNVISEATYRVWRLYMAGSAHGFAHGRLAVYQVLLAKPDARGVAGLPLTRNDWYAPSAAEKISTPPAELRAAS